MDNLRQQMSTEEAISLQNDLVQVRILPSYGGKIASIRSVRTGEEFLLPSMNPYRHVASSAGFNEGDGGGFDECLPSIARCDGFAGEPPVPDHGDLWRLSWIVDSQDESVTLHAETQSRPLRLTRRATLSGSSLVLDYELLNLSDRATTWLWSAHPLLKVGAEDRIELPGEIGEVAVEYSAAEILNQGSLVSWPMAESVSKGLVDLSRVGERDGETAHKLFAHVNKAGWCALYRHRARQGLVLRFSPSELPFIGLWICSGAWPQTGVERQYTVALEPTTSNTDSLATAVRGGTARNLGAGQLCRWRLEIELLGASASLDAEEFRACAQEDSSTSNSVASSTTPFE
jgi:galactose mutarotase-like enzyme